MAKFRDVKTLQKFSSAHASIHNHSHGDWLVKGGFYSRITLLPSYRIQVQAPLL